MNRPIPSLPRCLLLSVLFLACSLSSLVAWAQEPAAESGLNPDHQRRDQLLGLTVDWAEGSGGGVAWFESLGLDALEALFAEGFVDPLDRQNAAPTAGEFLEYLRRFPAATVHGYAVSPEREDYRVSVEGLFMARQHVTFRARLRARALCRRTDAREFRGDLYCWYD